jgi:hypothetical protein
VLLRIPVAQREAWRRFGPRWAQLDAPRHTFLHTPTSIALLAQKAGLELYQTTDDSTSFQFYASVLYERGLPLIDEQTGRFRDPQTVFGLEEMERFEKEAAALNRTNQGDQACFYLRRAR